jgi:hypothetical protein
MSRHFVRIIPGIFRTGHISRILPLMIFLSSMNGPVGTNNHHLHHNMSPSMIMKLRGGRDSSYHKMDFEHENSKGKDA